MDSNGCSMKLTHDSKEKKGKKTCEKKMDWRKAEGENTVSTKPIICILLGNNMIPVKI